jgi:hypothetical protein
LVGGKRHPEANAIGKQIQQKQRELNSVDKIFITIFKNCRMKCLEVNRSENLKDLIKVNNPLYYQNFVEK